MNSKCAGVYYEQGNRDYNQDSLTLQKVYTLKGELLMAVVCDGLGGMDCGEIASGYICEKLSCWFYEELIDLYAENCGIKVIINSINRLLTGCHYDLINYGINNNIKTGSTVSLFLALNKKYIVLGNGDSFSGKISNKTERYLNKLNIYSKSLQSCIGIGNYYKPFIKTGFINYNDSFMLFTDGFYHNLNIRKLCNQVKNIETDEMADKILKTIGKHNISCGENDNMSAILIKY